MIDKAKFGEAVARVLDRLDKLIEVGELSDEYEIGEVLVVTSFIKPAPKDEIEPDAVEIYVFVDGTTQVPYIQDGLLRYGISVAGSGDVSTD